jgi:hypothetical protein
MIRYVKRSPSCSSIIEDAPMMQEISSKTSSKVGTSLYSLISFNPHNKEEEKMRRNNSMMDLNTNYEWKFDLEMQQFNV